MEFLVDEVLFFNLFFYAIRAGRLDEFVPPFMGVVAHFFPKAINYLHVLRGANHPGFEFQC